MCHARRAGPSAVAHDTADAPRTVSRADRAGDADRERMAGLIGDAHAGGYLTAEELDDRLSAVFDARTRGDLDALGVDLPDQLRFQQAHRISADPGRARGPTDLRGPVASYVGVMALLVAIWLMVGVSAGAWYPWPVWPAVGWGLGLVGRVRFFGLSGPRGGSARASKPSA